MIEVLFEYEVYDRMTNKCLNLILSGQIEPKRQFIIGEDFEDCYKKLARWIYAQAEWAKCRYVIKNYKKFPLTFI